VLNFKLKIKIWGERERDQCGAAAVHGADQITHRGRMASFSAQVDITLS